MGGAVRPDGFRPRLHPRGGADAAGGGSAGGAGSDPVPADWRASIIPLIAVPVSVVGTFSILYLLGFSLNTLSLFGLVLAIGIVVDDAIVVVENVERNIEGACAACRGVSGDA